MEQPKPLIPNECPAKEKCPNHGALLRIVQLLQRVLGHRDAFNDAVSMALDAHNQREQLVAAPPPVERKSTP